MEIRSFKYERYLRSEHLLLLMPSIFMFLAVLYSPEMHLDVFVAGTYVRVSILQSGLFWIAFSTIPYFFHVLLRDMGLRTGKFPRIHVIFSILLMLVLYFTYKQTPVMDQSWNQNIIPIPTYDYLERISRLVFFLWMSLLLLQFAFMLFSFYKILFANQRQNSEYDNNFMQQA